VPGRLVVAVLNCMGWDKCNQKTGKTIIRNELLRYVNRLKSTIRLPLSHVECDKPA
jgi:hypothetical protein